MSLRHVVLPLFAVLAVAAPAQAADLNKGGILDLLYGDTQGVDNDLTLSAPWGTGKYRFSDTKASITVDGNCKSVNAKTADCPADGIGQIAVVTSAGNDDFGPDNSIGVPLLIAGGYGNDTLHGGHGDDIVLGGWDNDEVSGGD